MPGAAPPAVTPGPGAMAGDGAGAAARGAGGGATPGPATHMGGALPAKHEAATQSGDTFEGRLEKALRKKKETACTTYSAETDTYEWKSLRTPPWELGAYGVGNQLYFEFMFSVGVLFLILFVLNLPSLICALMGTFVGDVKETMNSSLFFKVLAKFTLANLGSCVDCVDYADFRERKLTAGSGTMVSDLTPWFGNLDALGQLLVLVFSAWMLMYRIPRIERTQDEAFTTAADFSVEVCNLPRRLPEEHHRKYEEQLRDHLQSVLVAHGVDPEEARPVEIYLVRDFGGALNNFNAQGCALKELENHEFNLQHHRDEIERCWNKTEKKAHEKRIARLTAKHEETKRLVMAIEEKLALHNDLLEGDRDVCGAYVMLNQESVRDKLLKAYSSVQHPFCQGSLPHHLRFHGWRIRVKHACEPTDLIHENLDFHCMKRECNRLMVYAIVVIVVICNLLVLVYLRSVESPPDTSVPLADTWVLRPSAGNTTCWSMCTWNLYPDLSCSGSSPLRPTTMYDDRAVAHADGGSCWTSPACDASAGPTQNYFAVELPSPSYVRCMNFLATFEAEPEVEHFDMWSCLRSEAGGLRPRGGGGGGADARLEDKCVQYRTSNRGEAWVAADTHCAHTVAYNAARLAKDSGEDPVGSQRIRCFCFQQSLLGSTFFAPPYDTPEKHLCRQWITTQLAKHGYIVGGIVLVIVVNLLIFVLFTILAAYIRFERATHRANHELVCLFWPKFFNTGLSALLVSMNFHGAFDNVGLGWTQLGSGPYDDVSPGWFVVVGTSLFVGFLGQAGCALGCPLFYNWILNPGRIWLFKSSTRSQAALNDLYVLPEWPMSRSLAEGMVVIFCCIVYGAGMPLCYLLGALFCTGTYWVEKYTLLRHSRKPKAFNSSTIRRAIGLLPIAVFCHLCVAMYFFGNQDLLPSSWGPLLGFCEWKFGVTRVEYIEITEDFNWAGTRAKLEQYPTYANARSLDSARASCFGLMLIAWVLVAYACVFVLRFSLKPCCRPIDAAVRTAGEWLLAKSGAASAAGPGKLTSPLAHAEAKERARIANHVFSYRITENPDYAEACAALSFRNRVFCA